MTTVSKAKAKKVAIILFSISALIFIVVILATNSSSRGNKVGKITNNDAIAKDQTVTNGSSSFTKDELNLLKRFQEKWADSVVKIMNTGEGGFSLVGVRLNLPDSISFEYSEGVTRKGFYANLNVDTVLYRQWYNEAIGRTFANKYSKYPVYITCIPNRNVNIEDITKKENALKSRQAKIAGQFSAWDGAHLKLQEYIKKNMNDPETYEHIKSVYDDKGTHILVITTFRGKNALGSKVIEKVAAKVDLEGNILSIEKY